MIFMDETQLKDTIERKKGRSSYSSWTIGITNDPSRRKKEHENEGDNVAYWAHWRADTLRVARNIESYFIDKGMKGGSGGPVETPLYVYVY